MVANLINSNGRAVANQFVITNFDNNGNVESIQFQSYNSLICDIRLNCGMGYDAHIVLGRDYDYSRTTMKHLIGFLGQFACTKEITCIADLRKAIDKGYFKNESVRYSFDETMY